MTSNSTSSMFGPTTDVPVELVLQIFSDPCLEDFGLFRLSGVNKEWRSFIYGWGDTRELMFLPCLSSTRTPPVPASLHGSNEAVVYIDQVLPYKFGVKSGELDVSKDRQPDVTTAPWNNLKIHPMLNEFRPYKRPQTHNGEQLPVELAISYQLLTCCNKTRFRNVSATWRQMLVTQPPLRRLSVVIQNHDCVSGNIRPWSTQSTLHNQNGVTLGDVLGASWQSRLPRNAGLVPDYGSCARDRYYPAKGRTCHCYHITRLKERAHENRVAVLETEREFKSLVKKIEAEAREREEKAAERTKGEDRVVPDTSKGGRLRDERDRFRKDT